MSLVKILKIADDEESLETISQEVRTTKQRSKIWEDRITSVYENFTTGKKLDQGDFDCYTAYKCLEKIIKDSRSVEEIVGYWKRFKSVDKFNEFMTNEIYARVRKLIAAFFPPVTNKKTGQTSFNQSLNSKLSDMKLYVFESHVFDLQSMPWKKDVAQIIEALGSAFKKTKLEKKQSQAKAKKRNDRLALSNLEFVYEEQRLIALELHRTFYQKENMKPKLRLYYGTYCAQMSGILRLSEPVRSDFSRVPGEYKDVLGDMSEEGTYAELTPSDSVAGLQFETLSSLKSQVILQRKVLKKKKKDLELDAGNVKFVSFLTTEQFLKLVDDVRELFDSLYNGDPEDGRAISNFMSYPKYRDEILNKYWPDTIRFFEDDIETQTKTHFLRALSAAVAYYLISKYGKLFFNGKLLNRSTVGAILLGHSELGSAFQSYDYITVTGQTYEEAKEMFQITDENLVVTLANRLVQLEKQFETYKEEVESHKKNLANLRSDLKKEEPAEKKGGNDVFVKKHGKFDTDWSEEKQAEYMAMWAGYTTTENNTKFISWNAMKETGTGMKKRTYEELSRKYNKIKRQEKNKKQKT